MTQIFRSYGRDTDLLPPNLPTSKTSGFATALPQQFNRLAAAARDAITCS